MEKSKWKLNKRTEIDYGEAINSLIIKHLGKLESIEGLMEKLHYLVSTKEFVEAATKLAYSMVTKQYKQSSQTWREAAHNHSYGAEIYRMLRNEMRGPVGAEVAHLINRNASLIRSLPLHLAEETSQYVFDRNLEGVRHEQIARELREKFPEMTEAKAKLIARTEAAKANANILEVRSKMLGIPAYIWRTSKDERVRDSHRHMEGMVIFWDDPPDPEKLIGKKSYGNYHAGNIFNDRCFAAPIILLEEVKFPVKVYVNGSVVIMNRKQFEARLGR